MANRSRSPNPAIWAIGAAIGLGIALFSQRIDLAVGFFSGLLVAELIAYILSRIK